MYQRFPVNIQCETDPQKDYKQNLWGSISTVGIYKKTCIPKDVPLENLEMKYRVILFNCEQLLVR